MTAEQQYRNRAVLAKHLREKVPAHRWDMSAWSGDGSTPNDCGTVGCAAGHAAEIPELREQGYSLGIGGQYPCLADEDGGTWAISFNALTELFGFREPFTEGSHLYEGKGRVTPVVVAEVLEAINRESDRVKGPRKG